MGIAFDYPESATPLDPDESEGLILALGTQSELNEFEALNIVEAALWARRSTKVKRALLKDETLRLLHVRMFGKTWRWPGSYRRTQKSIGCEAWRISTELKILLDDARAWLEFETYPPKEIAARFHHRLVWIHPFPNGNGRFARLATDLLCVQRGWKVPTWGFSDLVNVGQARSAYLEALRAADRHHFDPLIAFMFSGRG